MKFILKSILCAFFSLIFLSGCIVSTAVGITTTAIGTAVDVVDAVTPDIIDDDDDDEDEDEDEEEDKD